MDPQGMIDGACHVVWDWNGTLLDDAAACVEALNRMLARRGLAPTDLELYREHFTFPVREYYRTLGFDMDREDWDRMAREYHAHYAETSVAAPLQPGARTVLESLASGRIGMSVLSACEQCILDAMLRTHGLDGFFGHVAGLSDLYAASKLETGKRLMKRLGLNPAEVVIVGDTLHDHEVAKALRCRCVLVVGGHQSERRLRQAGRPVATELPSILGLARQDWSVR